MLWLLLILLAIFLVGGFAVSHVLWIIVVVIIILLVLSRGRF